MTTLNVSLSDDLAAAVRERVDSGRYDSEDAVFGAALTLMLERDTEFARMDEKIRRGSEQAERGEFVGKTIGEIAAAAKAANQ